jgi:kynureninase
MLVEEAVTTPTRAECAELDDADPLDSFREEFFLPADLIYLLGNSLGPLPRRVVDRLERATREEWGAGLIRSWGDAGWWNSPITLGAKLAPLLGAQPSEVIVADSTSLNTFKTVCAAAALRPGRSAILTDSGNFPTDLYMVDAAARAAGGLTVRRLEEIENLSDHLNDDVAVVELSHVDYRSSRLLPMREITSLIHGSGALVVWDLAHSAGAVEVALDAAGADFAVGCTYKYLNGGPGSPAYLYVASRHLDSALSPLPGWHGHARPFSFEPKYEPAPGIRRFACGSPPVLSYAALEASLSLFDEVNLSALFSKGRALSALFIELLAETLRNSALELASPLDASARGCHVALRHPDARTLVGQLESRGVLVDFREPDFIRAGLAPLYLRYVDVFDAAAVIEEATRDLRPSAHTPAGLR